MSLYSANRQHLASIPQKRFLHVLNSVYSKYQDGINPFLSSKAINFIRQDQSRCLEKVNLLVKGSKLEDQTINRIVEITFNDLSNSLLYNHASQAWNNDFFLSGLSRYEVAIPHPLKSKIDADFGSLDNFIKEFSMYAQYMFGNGWTWLIRNEEGKLQITNTINGGSPIYHPNIVKKDPLSLPSLLGQKIHKRIPLLVLNMWQHAFIPDYEINKTGYISSFWKSVDWDRIDSYLPHSE